MAHDHDHLHGAGGGGAGHNHAPGALHSHPHGDAAGEALQVLTAQFIDGWLGAADKTAYLRLAGVPFELAAGPGEPSVKLVDVGLRTEWQVATASPGFGSAELSYLPFPGPMVRERTNMAFTYVSLRRRVEVDLRAWLASRADLG